MRAVRMIWCWTVAAVAAWALSACGGGNSTVTTLSGGGLSGSQTGPVVAVDQPTGPNTAEVVIDSGPVEAFSLGVVNIPYVTVTVCLPGSATRCVTIDHVMLDTGSVGLRLLKSTVASLGLPALEVPADAATGTPAGQAVECYPFVIGGIWGPVVRGDVQIGGERAAALPLQLVDDAATPSPPAPADCLNAAEGTLLKSVTTLQAKGVLGIGMLRYDCGLACDTSTSAGTYVQYYACSASGCTPARLPADLQLQNPIAHFEVNNNGSALVLPAIPETGASVVRGRLVMGIGTQTNNQLPVQAQLAYVDTDPQNAGYLYVTTTANGRSYPSSYIDSGSNGLFFDDPSIGSNCTSNADTSASKWYCPPSAWKRTATLHDAIGTTTSVDFTVAGADLLFSTSNIAFAGLGGTPGPGSDGFVWGLPFFYGRTVYTSIWGQALAVNGPWWAF